jgi:hypothetical protein
MSELQRVARGLVECLDQIPLVVEHLHRTANRCRQHAGAINQLCGDTPQGRDLALHLDAAARACDQAAHHAAQAPPKARTWAHTMISDQHPTTHQPHTPEPPQDPQAPTPPIINLSTTNPDHHETLKNPPPNTTLHVDDRFTYHTDHLGRVTHATTTLTHIDLDHPRNTTAQRHLPDKNPDDHAGHIFARIFQGPAATINLTPMHGTTVNQSAYRRLENRWAKAIRNGQDGRR